MATLKLKTADVADVVRDRSKGDVRRFATPIFSATQHHNIVATLFRMLETLFHHCYALLC